MAERIQKTWRNRRGEAFHVVGWPGRGDTAVLVHHGLGEHIGRYQTLADRLDLPIWGYDARGHGHSEGPRGDADGLGQLAEDLETLIPVLLEASGCEHAVLLGHSMGAAATLWYLATRRRHPAIRAALVSAPPVLVGRSLEMRVKAAAARVVRKVAPRLTLSNALPLEGISSVPEEVRRYQDDPLVHDRVSARLGWSLLHDAPTLVDRAAHIDLPILLWHGADDPIALVGGSRLLAERLPNVRYQEIPRARHEVHHEQAPIVDALLQQITAFLSDARAEEAQGA